jgi:hypothetical protein
MALYRAQVIDSAAWGAACEGAAPPLGCLPRQALLWLEYRDGLGVAALVLGVAALLLRSLWLSVAGVVAGGVAVVNYNIAWGMVGAAVAGLAWLAPDPLPGNVGGRGSAGADHS